MCRHAQTGARRQDTCLTGINTISCVADGDPLPPRTSTKHCFNVGPASADVGPTLKQCFAGVLREGDRHPPTLKQRSAYNISQFHGRPVVGIMCMMWAQQWSDFWSSTLLFPELFRQTESRIHTHGDHCFMRAVTREFTVNAQKGFFLALGPPPQLCVGLLWLYGWAGAVHIVSSWNLISKTLVHKSWVKCF